METVTYIAHHGILGQKWGVRRYQNKDGSLTRVGKEHYSTSPEKASDYITKDGDLTEKGKTRYQKYYSVKHDLDYYKREAYNGVIDDIEVLELLTMEEHENEITKQELIEKYPEAKEVCDKIDSYDYKWEEGRPEYLSMHNFVEIYDLGVEKLHHSGDSMNDITYIAHHGILGQKWGVRRYQRKDGTLTKAGRKRYADAKAFVNRVDGAAPSPKPKPKKISEMTDEELKNAITRMTSEKQAYGLQADIRSYTTLPKQPSAGQKFGAALGKVLLDSAKQAGPDILKAVVSASLGIEMPSKDKNKDKSKDQKKNDSYNNYVSNRKEDAKASRDKAKEERTQKIKSGAEKGKEIAKYFSTFELSHEDASRIASSGRKIVEQIEGYHQIMNLAGNLVWVPD